MKKLTGLYRAGHYAAPAFWCCDDTNENRKVLLQYGIAICSNTFIAADGTRVRRLEFTENF